MRQPCTICLENTGVEIQSVDNARWMNRGVIPLCAECLRCERDARQNDTMWGLECHERLRRMPADLQQAIADALAED